MQTEESSVGWATDLRQELHQYPEVGFEVQKTHEILKRCLKELQFNVVNDDLGGYGILATRGSGRPHILLRADMDALPIPGPHGDAHHACGHDGHMAMLLGAMHQAKAQRWTGRVSLILQPSEETGEGMLQCLDAIDAWHKKHPIDAGFGVHNIPGVAEGTVLIRPGLTSLASTGVHWQLQGSTSHASQPELGSNPIELLPFLIQQVLAAPRTMSAFDTRTTSAIVGVHGGGARYGTSAGDAELMATLRSENQETLDEMIHAITRQLQALAEAKGVQVSLDRVEPFPETANDANVATRVRDATKRSGLRVEEAPIWPWSEDFGYLARQIPSAFVGLGSGEGQPSLHRPEYVFPDSALEPGIRFWLGILHEMGVVAS